MQDDHVNMLRVNFAIDAAVYRSQVNVCKQKLSLPIQITCHTLYDS